jgi:hypothetical protein
MNAATARSSAVAVSSIACWSSAAVGGRGIRFVLLDEAGYR